MLTITRRLEWDAGHRVLGHEGKCAHLHGHRYAAELTMTAREGLDKIGRVVDFGVVKSVVGGWIDMHWDHNMMLHEDDPLLVWASEMAGPTFMKNVVFVGKPPYVMSCKRNPTAENLAMELFQVAGRLLNDHNIQLVAIRIYETPSCWADYASPQ